MAQVFVDTSALYALLNRSERHHAQSLKILMHMKRKDAQPVISNFIVAETHALLLIRISPHAARTWLSRNIWKIERVTEEDEVQARQIIETHKDKSYSFTDATSFALMQRLRIKTAFAFDQHFSQFGLKVWGPHT